MAYRSFFWDRCSEEPLESFTHTVIPSLSSCINELKLSSAQVPWLLTVLPYQEYALQCFYPLVTFLQKKTPKMTWQNPCWHSYFWHCTEDCLGRSGFKWKKKGRQKMTSCTETDVLKETKREIPLSPKNANNIDDQISRIVSKWVLFKFPSRYSPPFIYFNTKQACHLSQEKGETPQYVQAS